jgi:hypothetical protein
MLDLIQIMQEWLLELLGGYSRNVLITYTRAFRNGDHVRLSDAEGKIIERTAFGNPEPEPA